MKKNHSHGKEKHTCKQLLLKTPKAAIGGTAEVQNTTPSEPTAGRRSSKDTANVRVLALANLLTKARASSDQRPPTSAAKTTKRAPGPISRHHDLHTDGVAHRPHGWRNERGVDRQSGTTEKCGKPSATTSSRRPSWPTTGRSKSRTKTLVETRALASRQTRAAALSTEKPRPPSTPAVEHAARSMDVEETATPSGRRSEWNWKPETAKEKHAEGTRRRRGRDGREKKS